MERRPEHPPMKEEEEDQREHDRSDRAEPGREAPRKFGERRPPQPREQHSK